MRCDGHPDLDDVGMNQKIDSENLGLSNGGEKLEAVRSSIAQHACAAQANAGKIRNKDQILVICQGVGVHQSKNYPSDVLL